MWEFSWWNTDWSTQILKNFTMAQGLASFYLFLLPVSFLCTPEIFKEWGSFYSKHFILLQKGHCNQHQVYSWLTFIIKYNRFYHLQSSQFSWKSMISPTLLIITWQLAFRYAKFVTHSAGGWLQSLNMPSDVKFSDQVCEQRRRE